jgi:hypothetical protein
VPQWLALTPETDLAILHIDLPNLTPIVMADAEEIAVGDVGAGHRQSLRVRSLRVTRYRIRYGSFWPTAVYL